MDLQMFELGPLLGVIYIALAVVMFFPARFLWLHGKGLKAFTKSGTESEYEASLRHIKSFWKFYGIVAIVYLGIIALAIVGIIIAGIVAAF
jgi:hypothetical protein